VIALAAFAAIVTALARSAFRRGRRRDTRRLPSALGSELRAHKLGCLGEPPERVDLELRLLLGETGLDAAASRAGDIPGRRASQASLTSGRGTAARRS